MLHAMTTRSICISKPINVQFNRLTLRRAKPPVRALVLDREVINKTNILTECCQTDEHVHDVTFSGRYTTRSQYRQLI